MEEVLATGGDGAGVGLSCRGKDRCDASAMIGWRGVTLG